MPKTVVPQLQFIVGRRHLFRSAEADPLGPGYSPDHRDSTVAVRFQVVDDPVVRVVQILRRCRRGEDIRSPTACIVEVTVRARQSKPSLRCGHVLGLRMLLDVVSRLGADTVLLQMRGCSRRFAAPNACDLDVIRRLAAVRARAAFDGVSGVADMVEDHGVGLSVFAFPRIRGVKPQSNGVDAGKRPHIASMAEAEATPRVDVGEVSTTMVSRRSAKTNQPVTRSLLEWTGRHWSFKSGKIRLSQICVLWLLVVFMLHLISVTSRRVANSSVCCRRFTR